MCVCDFSPFFLLYPSSSSLPLPPLALSLPGIAKNRAKKIGAEPIALQRLPALPGPAQFCLAIALAGRRTAAGWPHAFRRAAGLRGSNEANSGRKVACPAPADFRRWLAVLTPFQQAPAAPRSRKPPRHLAQTAIRASLCQSPDYFCTGRRCGVAGAAGFRHFCLLGPASARRAAGPAPVTASPAPAAAGAPPTGCVSN